jgi:hypothetical protein
MDQGAPPRQLEAEGGAEEIYCFYLRFFICYLTPFETFVKRIGNQNNK